MVAPRLCVEEGCELLGRAWGRCEKHRPVPVVCARCAVQVDALAADFGFGDRVGYFAALTPAQQAAYMLGWLDASSGDTRAPAKVTAIAAGHRVQWWKRQAARA
jgi:hypothetical protein